MVSHKAGFHQNINDLDSFTIQKEVKRLLNANISENRIRFDKQKHHDMVMGLPQEKAKRLIDHAYRPCSPLKPREKSPTAFDHAREERKRMKKARKSRRS